MALERMIPEIGEIPRFPVQKLEQGDWRDGLLVRSPNWLGDAVMTLPALRVLRKIVPEPCGLFVACPKGIVPFFEALPGLVDKVIPLSDPHAFPTRSEWKDVRWLQAGAAVLFNNSFRDALWIKSCRIPKLYGAAARFRSLLLERAFQFPPRLDHELNKPHQAAKYLAVALALGGDDWDGILPEIVIPEHPELYPDAVRSCLQEKNLLALAPGAAYGAAKRWDPESFREVARWWIQEQNGKVVLVSGKTEIETARPAVEGLPAEFVIDLAGKTSLDMLMLILRRAKLCVANDSGAMHLAAALGTPGVVPFGSTDPAATSPISTSWRMLFDKHPCAPCFKRVCPYGSRACMKAVKPADVIAAAADLLSAN